MSVREVFERQDYATIGETIAAGSRVLDLGCGDGALLVWLMENKRCHARGVELDGNLVQQAIARGASVYQGDMAQSLSDYPDGAFDYVILSQTLQQVENPVAVLREMLRVGKRMVIGFPNFGHWTVRWALARKGRMPVTERFPYAWHESPNIHMLTIDDFEDLCRRENWKIENRIFLSGNRRVRTMPNLMAEVAVYLVTKS